MAYIVLRLVYGLYIIVTALIVVRALSLMLFRRNDNELKSLLMRLLFAFVWPLAIFSVDGRRYLKEALPIINRFN